MAKAWRQPIGSRIKRFMPTRPNQRDDSQRQDDNSLVIAIGGSGIYARRLLRNKSDHSTVVLTSEVEDPRRRPPAEFMRVRDTRLLRVVGIVLDEKPNYERSQDEVILETASPPLNQVRAAFKVDGDSAQPLALPGQVVLGGDAISPSDLNKLEGAIVAIADSDGEPFLKRVGAAIPGKPYVRQFEPIGGRGKSIVRKTEQIEDELKDVPVIVSCRRILGVLY